jgi:hypothetical protein
LTPGEDQQAREVGRTTERELNVLISSGVGNLALRRGEPEKIFAAEEVRAGDVPFRLDYEVRNRIGYLDVRFGEEEDGPEKKKTSFNVSNFKGGSWLLRFSDAVPISFDVEQAVGTADLNLTGLQVKDFTLSAGMADVTVRFDDMNRASIENMTIESGLSKFTGLHLGNANFKHLRFNGGLGSYELDFSGSLSGEVDVEVELGMGSLTVIIPPDVGVRILFDEGWLSKLEHDRDIRKSADAEYTSENLASASAKINLRIDAGVGTVKVRRR